MVQVKQASVCRRSQFHDLKLYAAATQLGHRTVQWHGLLRVGEYFTTELVDSGLLIQLQVATQARPASSASYAEAVTLLWPEWAANTSGTRFSSHEAHYHKETAMKSAV